MGGQEEHGAEWIFGEARGFMELGEEFCSLETSKLLREAGHALEVERSLRREVGELGAMLDRARAALWGRA